ncbi:MAG: TolB family protein [Caldilineaceae bacterium]
MLVKRAVLVFLFLLTGCIKPISDRVEEQPATAKEPVEKLAYVADRALWLTTLGGTDKQPIDACPPQPAYCYFTRLRWSPDGNYLLYLKNNDSISTLHLADRAGNTHRLPGTGEDQIDFPIPAWSADGQSLIYLQDGLRQMNSPFTEMGHEIGTVSDFGDGGCGGGGFPVSEFVYWQEGLATFPYNTPPSQLIWLANDQLLYTRNCTGTGLGRFDLRTGRPLPRLDSDRLMLVTTNRQRDRWAAITTDHHLAIGLAQAGLIITSPIADSIPTPAQLNTGIHPPGTTLAGGVFYGAYSGRLYYTTRQLQTTLQIDEQGFYALDPPVQNLFITYPHFPIYQTTLYATTQTDWEHPQIVWQGDAYGIGSVSESASGDILFVRIDNGQALYKALKAKKSITEVEAVWPTGQIMRIPAAGSAPQVLLDNAGQVALVQIHRNK